MNNDEFSTLVENTNDLLERININYKMTRPWTYQLAHEIKTPLSILSFDVESLSTEELKDKSLITSMKDQIERISIIVSQFLEWASVENTQQKDNLFALRIANSIETQCEGLERIFTGRLNYKTKEEFMVISNPQHLHQLINNLLTNALNYSPKESEVLIETFDNILRVTDSGNSIPAEVVERIGQPFNCGPQLPLLKHKLSGLGLAWINTITKIYNWNLDIQSGVSGTVITIKFTKILTT
jgi:signal transduction histidine kinase